jgi:hypothetical protein
MYGLSELQVAGLVLMVIQSGLLIGSMIGIIARALHKIIY